MSPRGQPRDGRTYRSGNQVLISNLLPSAIHAAQHHSEGSAFVVVRVPKHDEVSLSTALDAGAAAIVIPHTESADDVKRFIKDMYYRKSG